MQEPSMRVLRPVLLYMSAYPRSALKRPHLVLLLRLHGYYSILEALAVLIGQLRFLTLYWTTLSFLVAINCAITSRWVYPLLEGYTNIWQRFLDEFHLQYYRHKSSYHEKVYVTAEKILYLFAVNLVPTGLIGPLLFNIMPLYFNTRAGYISNTHPTNYTPEFAVYISWPYFDCFDHFYFFSIFNIHVSFSTGIGASVLACVLYTMVVHIIGHLNILNHEMRSMPRPQRQMIVECQVNQGTRWHECDHMYTAEENAAVRQRLIQLIEHYKMITSFTDQFSSFFGVLLLQAYSHLALCSCLMMLECSEMDMAAFSRYGPMTILTFSELIATSVIFEIIDTTSDKLSASVYSMPWESMDASNKRFVSILLRMVQQNISINVMGVLPAGVKTMESILRTTMSYFAFLRSVR